jgi:hypothetical protein
MDTGVQVMTEGLPSYSDVEDTIEKIVVIKCARWKFPGHDSDDIAQEIRMICFKALQKYDPSKENKGIFYFLAKSVDNGLYNMGRGIYFDNNPPCTRCPDFNKETKECCGSQRYVDYKKRMERRRAIDNPLIFSSVVDNGDNDTGRESAGLEKMESSLTGLVNLTDHIEAHLEEDLVPHFHEMVSGQISLVPPRIRRKIRERVKDIL